MAVSTIKRQNTLESFPILGGKTYKYSHTTAVAVFLVGRKDNNSFACVALVNSNAGAQVNDIGGTSGYITATMNNGYFQFTTATNAFGIAIILRKASGGGYFIEI